MSFCVSDLVSSRSMAVGRGSAFVSILLLLPFSLFSCVNAAQYTVGDDSEWNLNVDYDAWAAKYKFKVGDTLLFTYSSEAHNVYEVSKADYGSCSSDNPIKAYQDGKTVVTLANATSFYYICAVPSHCESGMKVSVTVEAAAATPPSSSPAPSPAAGKTPPPSPASPPTPATPASSPSPAPSSSSSSSPSPSPAPTSSPSVSPSPSSSSPSPSSPLAPGSLAPSSPPAPPSSPPSAASPRVLFVPSLHFLFVILALLLAYLH